ncbi:MAG: hypothetical protein QXL16_01150 [Candidatus Micrarchaeaceae archaeon]
MKVYVFMFVLLSFAIAEAQPSYFSPCSPTGFATVSGASWYCNNINKSVQEIWSKWSPIAILAALVSFLIAGVIFMVGVASGNLNVRNFALGELYEAIATTLIVVAFLFLSGIIFGVFPSSLFPLDPYITSLSFISSIISQVESLLSNLFNSLIIDYFYTSINLVFIASAQKIVGLLSTIISILFIIPASAIFDLLIDGLLVLHTEFYLIIFGMYSGIPVFIIPGVILRALPPTRGFGGTMISIGIGIFLVMPLLFSIAFSITNRQFLSEFEQASSQLQYYGQGSAAEQNAGSTLASVVQELQYSMGGFFLDILFFPAVIFGITYAFIVTISDFIGGFSYRTKSLGMARF